MFKLNLLTLLFLLWCVSSKSATYYVNDNSTTGDVFCSAVGNNSNNGTAAATPKLTISNLLSSYVLTDNDLVYIDAGTYNETFTITSSDDGSASGNVTFEGASKSLTIISNSSTPVTLDGCNYVVFKNMEITSSADEALMLSNADNNQIDNCNISYTGVSGIFSVLLTYSGGNSDNNKIFDCTIETHNQGVKVEGTSSVSQATNNEIYRCKVISNDYGLGGTGVELHSTTGTKVYRNRVVDFNNGIKLRRYNTSIRVYNNYISSQDNSNYPCSFHVSNDDNQTVEFINNSCYVAHGYPLHYENSDAHEHSTIKNNIFFNDGADDFSEYGVYLGSDALFTEIDNNLYYNPNLYIWWDGTNWLDAIGDVQAIDFETGANDGNENSIESDPEYNNATSTADDNLNLATTSPALLAGESVAWITEDIDGNPRPASPSIGAFDIIPLSVSLLDFSVIPENKRAHLKWEVTGEKSVSNYHVSISYDGKKYEKIGLVKPQNNPNKLLIYNYYTDLSKSAYFKLTETDFDGKEYVLGVKFIEQKENLNNTIEMFVFGRTLNLDIKSKIINEDLVLTSINGSVVYNQKVTNKNNQIIIPKYIKPGVYIARVGEYSKKIILTN